MSFKRLNGYTRASLLRSRVGVLRRTQRTCCLSRSCASVTRTRCCRHWAAASTTSASATRRAVGRRRPSPAACSPRRRRRHRLLPLRPTASSTSATYVRNAIFDIRHTHGIMTSYQEKLKEDTWGLLLCCLGWLKDRIIQFSAFY